MTSSKETTESKDKSTPLKLLKTKGNTWSYLQILYPKLQLGRPLNTLHLWVGGHWPRKHRNRKYRRHGKPTLLDLLKTIPNHLQLYNQRKQWNQALRNNQRNSSILPDADSCTPGPVGSNLELASSALELTGMGTRALVTSLWANGLGHRDIWCSSTLQIASIRGIWAIRFECCCISFLHSLHQLYQ